MAQEHAVEELRLERRPGLDCDVAGGRSRGCRRRRGRAPRCPACSRPRPGRRRSVVIDSCSDSRRSAGPDASAAARSVAARGWRRRSASPSARVQPSKARATPRAHQRIGPVQQQDVEVIGAARREPSTERTRCSADSRSRGRRHDPGLGLIARLLALGRAELQRSAKRSSQRCGAAVMSAWSKKSMPACVRCGPGWISSSDFSACASARHHVRGEISGGMVNCFMGASDRSGAEQGAEPGRRERAV